MILILDPLIQVFRLSLFTVFIGILLDTTIGLKTLIEIIKKDPNLYFKGLHANYINLLFISPIYYVIAYNLLLNYNVNILNLYKYTGLIFIHSIGYYGYKLLHVNKHLRLIHDFHHDCNYCPINRNVVSIYEFQFAYTLIIW